MTSNVTHDELVVERALRAVERSRGGIELLESAPAAEEVIEETLADHPINCLDGESGKLVRVVG